MSNTLNIKAIHAVADAIEKLPFKAFNMGEWMDTAGTIHSINNPNWNDRVQMAVDCETVGCIAGWTCVVLDDEWSADGYNHKPDRRARQLLGLTVQQAQVLFQPVVGTDLMCSYADITPQDAANALRTLADTGHVDWMAEPKPWHKYVKQDPEP